MRLTEPSRVNDDTRYDTAYVGQRGGQDPPRRKDLILGLVDDQLYIRQKSRWFGYMQIWLSESRNANMSGVHRAPLVAP
jgi:hypothetical protein